MFCLHLFSGINTMINGESFWISNSDLIEVVELHKNHPVFYKRQLTTFFIEFFSKFFSIEIGYSFVLVNFTFFFICGPLLFYLSQQIIKNSKIGLLSVLAFYLCFSNLFAFFIPVYTYDEPLQFCFMFLSLILFIKERIFWFILTFSLAIITRETAMILIPGLFMLYVYESKIDFKGNFESIRVREKTIALAVPILVYCFYVYFVMQESKDFESSRDYLLLRFSRMGYNFQNLDFIIETIGAIIIMYLIPIYFLFQSFKNPFFLSLKLNKFVKAFFLTLVINLIIVLLSARARELRLLVMPLFFLWPIFGFFMSQELKHLLLVRQNYFDVFAKIKYILAITFLTVLNFIVSFKIYHTTIGPKIGVFNVYLFLSISLIIIHYLIKHDKSKKHYLNSAPN